MVKFFESASRVFIAGIVLMVLMIFAFHREALMHVGTSPWLEVVLRDIHVFFGVLWIGLLYYFNMVQVPLMPKIPAEMKGAVSQHIAPLALFWFRWAAAGTVLFGLLIAWRRGYAHEAMTLEPGFALIGVGMWLGLIMAFNVWVLIWPNQKRVLGIVPAEADEKARAGKVALVASRINFMLSLPMLYAMTTYQTLPA